MVRRLAIETPAVTSEWQVAISPFVRASLEIKIGDQIEFVKIAKGQYRIALAKKSVQVLKGMLNKPDTPITIEQMDEAIAARGAAAR
jgi:bifunctional DNA-binding transcriptional regulator/antitoxin component of YhaV-PrlF toxin-antitoxin module